MVPYFLSELLTWRPSSNLISGAENPAVRMDRTDHKQHL